MPNSVQNFGSGSGVTDANERFSGVRPTYRCRLGSPTFLPPQPAMGSAGSLQFSPESAAADVAKFNAAQSLALRDGRQRPLFAGTADSAPATDDEHAKQPSTFHNINDQPFLQTGGQA
jgi:hypothetical protein